MIDNKKIITIENKQYLTVGDFARAVNHTVPSINRLYTKGNQIRKLVTMKFGKWRLIPIEELTDFPFTTPGHRKDGYAKYYNYDETGKEFPVDFIVKVRDI